MDGLQLIEKIVADFEKQQAVENDPIKIRYAYADPNRLTWFISPSKWCPIKGTRLLLVLSCEKTDEPLFHPETYPTIGTVLTDKNGEVFKVVDVKWI